MDNIQNEIFQELSKFGLKHYEIKVYQTLFLYGPMTATRVASISGIPQPRIYDIFTKLIEKGFVETNPGKKKIFKAVPLEIILDRKIDELNETKQDILKKVKSISTKITKKEPYVWLIENKKNVKDKIKEMIKGAKHEVLLTVNEDYWKYCKRYIRDALKRGITVGIVLQPGVNEKNIEKTLEGAIIKRRSGYASQVVIVDREKGIIDISSERYPENYSIYVEEDEMVHVLNYYFYHTIWKPSQEIAYIPREKRIKITTNWLLCELANRFLSQKKKVEVIIKGRMENNSVEIKGDVAGTEIIEGLKHTLIVKVGDKVYTVGGKSAREENIALERAELIID